MNNFEKFQKIFLSVALKENSKNPMILRTDFFGEIEKIMIIQRGWIMNLIQTFFSGKTKETGQLISGVFNQDFQTEKSESNQNSGEFKKILENKKDKKTLRVERDVRNKDKNIKATKKEKIESQPKFEKQDKELGKKLEQKLNELKLSKDPKKIKLAAKISELIKKIKGLLNGKKNLDLKLSKSQVSSDLNQVLKELLVLINRVLDSKKEEKDNFSEKLIKLNAKTENLIRTNEQINPNKLSRMELSEEKVSEMEKIGKFAKIKKNAESEKEKKVTVKDLRIKEKYNTAKVKEKPKEKISKTEIKKEKIKNQNEQKFEIVKKTGEIARRQDNSFKQALQSYSKTAAPTKAHVESMFRTISGRAAFTLRDGKSELRMNLNPAELGKMHLKFEIENGIINAKIVVSTQEARNLFEQNLPDLQKQLQQSGVNVGSLDVSFGNQGENSGESGQGSFGASGGVMFHTNSSLDAGNDVTISSDGLIDSQVNFIA